MTSNSLFHPRQEHITCISPAVTALWVVCLLKLRLYHTTWGFYNSSTPESQRLCVQKFISSSHEIQRASNDFSTVVLMPLVPTVYTSREDRGWTVHQELPFHWTLKKPRSSHNPTKSLMKPACWAAVLHVHFPAYKSLEKRLLSTSSLSPVIQCSLHTSYMHFLLPVLAKAPLETQTVLT